MKTSSSATEIRWRRAGALLPKTVRLSQSLLKRRLQLVAESLVSQSGEVSESKLKAVFRGCEQLFPAGLSGERLLDLLRSIMNMELKRLHAG